MEDSTEAAAARPAAIIEAATGIFLRYGFKKTSMADLASAAGLSRQALYLYFP
jgi:AcrR family transcriptional regulator